MLKNYFKIAIRQLRKQKTYSAIKIGGFALSIAACLLIDLFIKDEPGYDKPYPDGDRIYRVVSGMTTMLSKDFIKLVGISIAIPSLIAW